MELCSRALEVPYDKVVAALSLVDGTLIRRKFVLKPDIRLDLSNLKVV